jgi:hypothetical protein
MADRREVPSWLNSEKRNFLTGKKMLSENSSGQPAAPWKRVDARLWGLLAITMVSLLFQLLLSGYVGGDRTTTPDTRKYIKLATEMQDALNGVGKMNGDVTRTPGYPLLVLFAAGSARIKLSDVNLPIRNWQGTNTEGKKLVGRIILLQEILGFAIPLIVYLIALSMGGSALLSFLVSLCYFSDIRSVAFQYVILTETLSVFLMLLTLLVFIGAIMRQSFGWIALCGIVTGLTVLVRPPLAVLPAILCGAAYLILRYDGANFKRSVSWLGSYVAIAAVFPLFWSFVNLQGTGHFFFTQNATVTLQNFAARHFVQLDIDDPELQVLQKHARQELERARRLNVRDHESYAFTRSFDNVANELALDDPMYLYSLASRANRIAILNFPLAFLHGGARRCAESWSVPFNNVKNRYAIDRIAEFGVPGRLLGGYGYMLFGPATFFCLLVLTPLAAMKMPSQTRILFVSLVAFAITYTVATTLADENEPIRHTMQARILVNGMLMAACCIIVGKSAYWRQSLRGRKSHQTASGTCTRNPDQHLFHGRNSMHTAWKSWRHQINKKPIPSTATHDDLKIKAALQRRKPI